MLKSIAQTIAILIGGGFLWLMGMVSMTGVSLSNPVDMAVFLIFNAFVLGVVVVALKQLWTKQPGSDAGE
jgi:hypothetical protein